MVLEGWRADGDRTHLLNLPTRVFSRTAETPPARRYLDGLRPPTPVSLHQSELCWTSRDAARVPIRHL